MTKIRMLKTVPVSPTGLVTARWAEGTIQHAGDDLLSVLIDMGACELVEDKAERPKLETSEPVVKRKGKRSRKTNAL